MESGLRVRMAIGYLVSIRYACGAFIGAVVVEWLIGKKKGELLESSLGVLIGHAVCQRS